MTATDDHRTDARTARPRPAACSTYARLDLRRQLRDRIGMFFIVALPTFMYLVFGLGSDDRVGSGNVAMYVMISMAAYGAVTATTSVAGSAATEQVMGWGRQLGAHPDATARVRRRQGRRRDGRGCGAGRADLRASGPSTGARGNWSDWVLAAAIVWLGSALFAIYGLAICLAFRGPNAAGIASGMIVVMAFLGNVFTPMSGLHARPRAASRRSTATPRSPASRSPTAGSRWAAHDPLWLPVANVLAWTVIFALLALWGVRRSRART